MKEYTYKNASTLSKMLLILLVLGVVLDAVAAFSGYLQYELLVSFQNGVEITEAQVNANDSRQGIIGILQSVCYIITVVIFCKWIHRMSRNAHSIENVSLKYTPGWAVGYFFIPIFCLWKPYQALREAYLAFIENTNERRDNIVFSLWWFAWIVANFIGNLLMKSALKTYFREDDIDQLIETSLILIGSDAFDVFLDLMAMLLVMIVAKACANCFGNNNIGDGSSERDVFGR